MELTIIIYIRVHEPFIDRFKNKLNKMKALETKT